MKYTIICTLLLMLSGCFLSYEDVDLRTKACVETGGVVTVTLNRDQRALGVWCNVNGVSYYVNSEGVLQ